MNGREIFLKEILINYLRNTEEYNDDTIKKRTEEYIELQKKEKTNKILTYEERKRLDFLEKYFNNFSNNKKSSTNGNIYDTFKNYYNISKNAVLIRDRIYNDIISSYLELINSSSYEDNELMYIKFLEYLKDKILYQKASEGVGNISSTGSSVVFKNKETPQYFIEFKIEENDDNKKIPEQNNQPVSNTSNFYITTQIVQPPIRFGNITNTSNQNTSNISTPKIPPVSNNNQQQQQKTNDKEQEKTNDKEQEKTNDKEQEKTNDKEQEKTNDKEQQKAIDEKEYRNDFIKQLLLLNPEINKGYKKQHRRTLRGGNNTTNDVNLENYIKNIDVKKLKNYISNLSEDVKKYNKEINSKDSDFNRIIDKIITMNINKKDVDVINIPELKSNILQLTNYKSTFQKRLNKENNEYELFNGNFVLIKNLFKGNGDENIGIIESIKNLDNFIKQDDNLYKKLSYENKISEEENIKCENVYNCVDIVINSFQSVIKIIMTNYETANKKIDSYINIINDFLNKEYNKKKDKDKEKDKEKKGGAPETEEKKSNDIDDDFNKVNQLLKLIDDIVNKISIIFENYITYAKKILNKKQNPINTILEIQSNNTLREENIDDPYNNSLYSKIWRKYEREINNPQNLKERVEDDLYTNIKRNNLDPNDALEITIQDKIIFIILLFILRIIFLYIINILIEQDKINSISYGLLYYNLFYLITISILILIINIDTYKLRIIFNYLNFHSNFNGILLNYVMIILLSYIIYLMLKNLNIYTDGNNQNTLSDINKERLYNKLEIITIIIFIFLAITIIII